MLRQLTSEQRPEQVTGSPQPGGIPLSIDEVTRTFTLFTSFREGCASVSPLRALTIDPAILLMDEPFGALDAMPTSVSPRFYGM